VANVTHIVADIGGTNARFAHVEADSGELRDIEIFSCADFPSLIDAIKSYLGKSRIVAPESLCLAVAGPVKGDWIDLPNNHWAFSQRDVAAQLGARLRVINDFTAQMLSTEVLKDSEFRWLGPNRPGGGGTRAVIGPGTGLGVAAMLASGGILNSEGGHMSFAPEDRHEAALLEVLWERFPRVSIERVLSGPGLENLYWANCRLDDSERELPAREITAGARAGDPLCLRAVNDFYAILGSWAGDIALMTGATDGVYLSGGILPRTADLMNEQLFLKRFGNKGRLSALVAKVPVAVIEADYPGLSGCARAVFRDAYGTPDTTL
jgi:glucokinase